MLSLCLETKDVNVFGHTPLALGFFENPWYPANLTIYSVRICLLVIFCLLLYSSLVFYCNLLRSLTYVFHGVSIMVCLVVCMAC